MSDLSYLHGRLIVPYFCRRIAARKRRRSGLFGFALLVTFAGLFHNLACAQRVERASVVGSYELDPNDGKHPIYHRQGDKLVAHPGVYTAAFGPSIMFDAKDQTYKLWAGVVWNGDNIACKQSKSLAELGQQPWEIVLEPRRTEAVADQEHCGDPCVMATKEGYYLYYSGAGKSERWPKGQAYVMVAFSKDGRKFKRLNHGLPIVDMGKACQPGIGYGVGQPAVTPGPDGWYYMVYTYSADDQYTNDASNYLSVIRSRKPDFIHHETVTRLPRRLYVCSNDLVYNPQSTNLVMLVNESDPSGGAQVRLVTFSMDFNLLADCHVVVTNLPATPFGEGLGLLTDPQRRWLYSPADPGLVTVAGATCGRRSDRQNERIAGPTRAISWRLDPAAKIP